MFARNDGLQDVLAADYSDGPVVDFDRVDYRADVALSGVSPLSGLSVIRRAKTSIFRASMAATVGHWAHARSSAALARSRSDFQTCSWSSLRFWRRLRPERSGR